MGASNDSLRIATFNVEGLKADEPAERVRALAEFIARLDADVILLNEVDTPPGDLLAGVRPLLEMIAELEPDAGRYTAVVRPTNTGVPSGFDLDNNGEVAEEPGGRAYGGDCFGYGEYPGQYGMVLLVRAPFVADDARVRTFARFLWKDMPGAALPESDGEPWYCDDELAVFRLVSKTMMDVPVRTPNGSVVHIVCAHPTPPVFDGKEDRNGKRNHDEIRLIADYLSGAEYITDDAGDSVPFPAGGHFVILGDMNADPDEGDSYKNPILMLLEHPDVRRVMTPRSDHFDRREKGLDPDDTSRFRLRVDYVLPSRALVWTSGRVIDRLSDLLRIGDEIALDDGESGTSVPSDHFPVVLDLMVPAPAGE